jgi:hypothetical protein
LGYKFITFLPKKAVQKRVLYFGIIWLSNCFGYFSKNWAILFQIFLSPSSQCQLFGYKIIKFVDKEGHHYYHGQALVIRTKLGPSFQR